jgi:predicted PurR-regulated permease PerM
VDLANLLLVEDKPSFPSDFQKRTMWKAVTGLAILTLGTLLAGLIWLTSSVLGYLQPVFVPLAVAGIVAYLLHPLVQWLQGKGFTRVKGIITVFVGFLLFFGLLFFFAGNKLAKQIEQIDRGSIGWMEPETLKKHKENEIYGWIVRSAFLKDITATEDLLADGGALTGPGKEQWRLALGGKTLTNGTSGPPEDLDKLFNSDWNSGQEIADVRNAQELIALENFGVTKGGQRLSNIGNNTLGWLSNSSGKILGFFGLVLGFAMVPIYLYYFLKESDAIKRGWKDYVPLKASAFKDEVVETLQEINGYLISFFRGQVLVAFIDGILVGIALTIFQLPYGLLIGVFMAFLGIIPYIGNIICLIPACIIAYLAARDGGPYDIPQWGYVFGVLAIFIVVQQINSLLTAPKIVGDSVGLHPMTVIFSMLFWSLLLGGFLGALLAVPLTAAVKVLFRRYVWDRQVQELEAQAPA